MICIQSMDGALTFFDRNNLGVVRFLPDFLLPGPICYVPESDSFVTADSSLYLRSYR
jgi:Bardet-Biedl syndrome 9 protein